MDKELILLDDEENIYNPENPPEDNEEEFPLGI